MLMTRIWRTDAIISLTAPKLGVKAFVEAGGRHLLGGRFVPMYVCPRLRYSESIAVLIVSVSSRARQCAASSRKSIA